MITSIQRAVAAKRDELKDNDKGFTLIELLVVVLIIGILAAIAIPVFLGQQESAKDSAVKSDLTNAKIAIIAWQVDNPGSSTLPTLNDTTLGDYGFTESEYTAFGTPSGNLTDGWTLTATRQDATDRAFFITDTDGVKEGTGSAPATS